MATVAEFHGMSTREPPALITHFCFDMETYADTPRARLDVEGFVEWKCQ